jgi:malate synthase
MGPDFEQSIAFQAALALVLEGREQPNGYTEYVLHEWRRQYKRALTPVAAL